MMSGNANDMPLSDQDKQTQPLPGEVDPKYVKVKVFMAAQKTKNRFRIRK